MANDPLWINASSGSPSYTANELRQPMGLPMMYGGRNVGARAGVRPGGTQLAVSIVGVDITVQPGLMYVDPGLSTPQGGYWVAISPAETHTLTAAHATNPRKDIIVARVYDNDEDSSGNRFGRTEYIAGVAAGSPVEPAVPTGAFRVATIDVPASGGGSPVVTQNHPFTVASGGILPCRTFSERNAISGPWDGLHVWRQDRDWLEAYNGSGFRVVSTPVVSSVGDLANVPNPFAGQFASNTADGLLYRYNGTSWFPLTLYARKTADETVNNAGTGSTLQDDNHLTVGIETTREYTFMVQAIVNSGTTPDWKFGWTVPSGATMKFSVHVTEGAGPTGSLLGPFDHSTPVALGTTGSDQMIEIKGTVLAGGTSGPLVFRWAQNTANAGNTTVKQHSYIELNPKK